MEPIDCVAFMLIAKRHILIEKRSPSKRLLPGVLAIPGGHVDELESIESALVRELHEELRVTPEHFTYLCTLFHKAEEWRRIHYFVIERWSGEICPLEAESLCWIPLDKFSELPLEIDAMAIEQYLARRF